MNIKKLLVTGIFILMTVAGCTSSKTIKNQALVVTPDWSKDPDYRKGTENNGLRSLGLDNDYLSK